MAITDSTKAANEKVDVDEAQRAESDTSSAHDVKPLAWEDANDPRNPYNWSSLRKWSVVTLISIITLILGSSSSIFGPAIPMFLNEFHSSDTLLATFTISEYAAGYVLGPLLFGPLSEVYGRLYIIHGSNLLFIVFTIACAVSSNIAMFLVFRFGMAVSLCGVGTIAPALIADIMPTEKRGRAMTIWAMSITLGPVLSPIVGGAVAQNLGWRWIFWLISICAGFFSLLTMTILRETYAPVLLSRVHDQNHSTTTKDHHNQSPTSPSVIEKLRKALIRPFIFLFHSPVAIMLAASSSMAASLMNLLFSLLSWTFETEYGFTPWQSGFAAFGMGLGFIIGQISIGAFSDSYVKRRKAARAAKSEDGVGTTLPEDRLPPLIVGAACLPIGMFWYGWSIAAHTSNAQWIIPILGTVFVGLGGMFSFLPVSMYLVDAFGIYAASATAANLVVRSVVSAVLPLAAEPLYEKVGFGWGNSVFGFLAVALIPLPIILMRFGERMRTNPRYNERLVRWGLSELVH